MRLTTMLAGAAMLCACQPVAQAQEQTLAEARRGHVTQLQSKTRSGDPVPKAPRGVLDIVQYPSPTGSLAAYLSPIPKDGRKHPAIIWMTGGDSNTIGNLWSDRDPANDQTAGAFREAGVLTMYPSLRGGNRNPGYREGMYGEVDDILAAADFLAKQPGVDPQRVYLGGHSTGGTLVLLVAEIDARFRATFAFGPVSDPSLYGRGFLPVSDPAEIRLRAPGRWLGSIRSPVFVIEGETGNIADLHEMERANSNPMVRFQAVVGASHFSVLAPATALIARKILADTGPKTGIGFTPEEIGGLIR